MQTQEEDKRRHLQTKGDTCRQKETLFTHIASYFRHILSKTKGDTRRQKETLLCIYLQRQGETEEDKRRHILFTYLWRHLETGGGTWRHLETKGDKRALGDTYYRHTLGDKWRHLETKGDTWRQKETLGDKRRHIS